MRLSLFLLSAQIALFAVAAVQMPLMKDYGYMNSMPLFQWMRLAPARASWWVWASIAILSILALNTLACAGLSLLSRVQSRAWLKALPPQVIHLGFLLMLAAHLASSAGALHMQHTLREGSAIRLFNGNYMRLARVEIELGAKGYPTDWSAHLEYYSPTGTLIKKDISAPNRPSFIEDLGVYIKKPEYGGALMEVHREPGTPWALAGGVLFTLGTIALVLQKIEREQ